MGNEKEWVKHILDVVYGLLQNLDIYQSYILHTTSICFFLYFSTIATVPVIYYKLITDEMLEALEGSGHTHTLTSRISED